MMFIKTNTVTKQEGEDPNATYFQNNEILIRVDQIESVEASNDGYCIFTMKSGKVFKCTAQLYNLISFLENAGGVKTL